jgi:hypothetical protein
MTPNDKHNDINFYTLLDIKQGASIQEIKSAFRKISMKTHPDMGGSSEEQARINHAYEILSDPVRRRLYDESLAEETVRDPERPTYKSKHSEEWEKSFRKSRDKKNIRDRVREEITRRSEEVRSGYNSRIDSIYADACLAFSKTRKRFIIFASLTLIFLVAGIFYPALWTGLVLSGYATIRYFRYGQDDDAVFVLNPEWKYILKNHARKLARIESDVLLSHLENMPDYVIQLISAARSPSSSRDSEGTILRRILIHFFLQGYMPEGHDESARIVTLNDGDEKIAFRYRHRKGKPVNAAFIKKLYNHMDADNILKGFIFAAPGLSKKAAEFAEDHAIACFSIREMNDWIGRMMSGPCPGPRGDIIAHISSLMKFMQDI